MGYAQPVGGVIAYEKQISISGVGFDIGCGNMAVRLDTPFSAIEGQVGEIIRDVQKVISFGVGRTTSASSMNCSTTATLGVSLTPTHRLVSGPRGHCLVADTSAFEGKAEVTRAAPNRREWIHSRRRRGSG
jgi:tRNA-splicing ligase RtcB